MTLPDFPQPEDLSLLEWADHLGRRWYRKGKVWHSQLSTDWVPSADGTHWDLILLEDLFIVFGSRHWRIPKGFRFDGASVRYKIVHLVYDRYGRREVIVACLHDWLYSDGQHEIPAEIIGDRARRAYADAIFDLLNDAMSDSPREEVRGNIALRAVRWFGRFVYKGKK
jgi:hypothetical protein